MTVNFEVRTKLRDLFEHCAFHRELGQPGTRACDSLAKLLLIRGERFAKSVALAIVRFATDNDVNAILKIVFSSDFGMQPEAIEQLWTQFAFFGIAGADQNKARRMFDRDTLTLDFINTRHRDVE